MRNLIPSVKGTRDFYPEQMRLRSWLYEKCKQASELAGFFEYEGPFLEYLDLYAAKSGDELVKEQSFVFQDRGGEWVTLRPELTPTLARMVAQQQRQLTFPLRWWSFGPMWRYERPQKGRSREFFQWNIDLIGINSPEADAELASIAANFFRIVGLSPQQVTLQVNNRQLVDSQLDKIGIPRANRSEYLRLIDRREKLPSQTWENYARDDFGLDQQQITGLITMLEDDQLWKSSPDFIRFFDALAALDGGDYVVFDPKIVRGLDYYTGTVFEARDADNEFRAILGGGRYDNLVADVGGDPLSGVGFAMGDMVISLVLEKFNRLPDETEIMLKPVLVTVFSENTLASSLSITAELRKNNIPAMCTLETGKLGKQFKYADRINAGVVLVLGPDEIDQKCITIKYLKTGEQSTVSQADLITTIKDILAQQVPS